MEDDYHNRQTKYSGRIKWRRGELLGTGAYGNVYLGLNQDTGELMGAKQILLRDVYADDVHNHIQALRTEISLMKELDHPNIVRYWGSDMDDTMNTLTIFMEYVSGGRNLSVIIVLLLMVNIIYIFVDLILMIPFM